MPGTTNRCVPIEEQPALVEVRVATNSPTWSTRATLLLLGGLSFGPVANFVKIACRKGVGRAAGKEDPLQEDVAKSKRAVRPEFRSDHHVGLARVSEHPGPATQDASAAFAKGCDNR